MPRRKKSQTVQQRFAFMDQDHKTPKHDEIMLWVDQNTENILQRKYGTEWNEKAARERFSHFSQLYLKGSKYENYNMPPLPPKPPIEVVSKEWEYVITNRNRDPVGFIDMAVRFKVPELELISQIGKPTWEISQFPHQRTVYFEIKSRILSLGEVIRKINMYRAYLTDRPISQTYGTPLFTPFIIVSPDDRFQKILSEQKIGFIKYPH